MTSRSRLLDILAGERFDVLEDEPPRSICSVRGCSRGNPVYPIPGQWGTFYVCSRHRPLYRTHNRILGRIRAIPARP